MDTELEKKLRDMLDRDEIWRVLQRFARGVDRVDKELLATCYHPDAVEDHGHYLGNVEGFMDYAHATVLELSSVTHHITTCNIDLMGDDAHVETGYIYIGNGAQGPHLMSSGRYVDHFQRRDNAWRIANRVCIIEGTYEIPDHSIVAALPPNPASAFHPTPHDRADLSYQRPVQTRKLNEPQPTDT